MKSARSVGILRVCLIKVLLSIAAIAQPIVVTVPGTANPWLAGAVDGTTASGGDVAPTHSPVELEVAEGDELQFYVTGWAGFAPGSETGPEGVGGGGFFEMNKAAENGIAGITWAPANALIGVFLSDDTPVAGGEPAGEDFSASSGRRDSTFRVPTLNVPFFIGNGVATGGVRQTVAVPVGATRLFLGTMDGSGWFNNSGSFTVNVRTVTSGSFTNQLTWGTPETVSGPDEVATSGTLVAARNLVRDGLSGSGDRTVNGVVFTEFKDGNLVGAGTATVTLTGGTTWMGDLGSASAPYANLDESYRGLLGTGVTRLGNASQKRFQVCFNGLVVGREYAAQFWVNAAGAGVNGFGVDEFKTVIAVDGTNSVQLDPNSLNADGGVGQWVTATFTAEEPGITFDFSGLDGGSPILNAFQVRDTTPPGPAIAVTGPLVGNAEEELVYQIAVTNPGVVTQAGLVVEAWLPSGTTKVSAPGSSTLFGGDDEGVTWTIPSLASGEGENFTLTVRSAAAQTLVPAAFAARAYLKKTGVGNLATTDFPATVIGAALPPVVGATALAIAPNGKKGISVGDQWATWTFDITQPLQPDIVVTPPRLQYRSGENGSVWTDLPGALRRGRTPVAWTLSTSMPLPGGSYFFRALTTRQGYSARSFQAPGIFLVVGKSRLEVEVTRGSDADPESNRTRPGDIVRYDIKVRNVGSTAAENVVVFGPVPAGMKDPVGSGAQLSTGPLIPNVRQRDSAERDLGLTWSISSLPAGASAVMNYSCIVLDSVKIGTLLQPTGVGAAEGVTPITNSKTFTAAMTRIRSSSGARPVVLPVARVNAGLYIKASAGGTAIAEVGGTITYTLSVQNLYNTARQEAVVWVRMPVGTQFASYGQASGLNFNGADSTLITTGTNPSLTRSSFADTGVLTWNLGNMAARENRTLVFTVRVGAELADTVVNADGSTSPNEIRLVEYNFRTRGVSLPFYAYPRPNITDKTALAASVLEQPAVRSLVTVPGPAGLPILGMSKELIGENDGYVNDNGVEMASVIVDDKVNEVHQVRSVIGISNRGGAAARLCRVVDAISPDLIFDGGVLVNGLPAVSGSVKLFDKEYREITSSVIAADSRRVFQAEVVMFEVGNIAPGATVTIDYKMRPKKMAVRDITKPIKDAVALKVGSIFPIPAPSLYSNSFTEAIPCRMTDPQGIVVSNSSLSSYVYPVKSSSTFGELQAYNTVIRNNGGGASGSVTFKATIPLTQAVYVETNFVDVDTGSLSAATAMTTKRVAGQASEISVIVPTIQGGRARIVQVVLRIKDQAQIKAADRQPDEKIALKVAVTQTAVASASRAAKTVPDGGAGLIAGATGTQTMEGVSNLDPDPNGPRTFVMKTTLLSVREGELLPYTITFGNHGQTAATGGTLAIIVPKDCDVVETGPQFTTGGFLPDRVIKAGEKVSWSIQSLAPGEVQVRQLVVRPKLGVKRIGGTIVEASCTFQCANASAVAPAMTVTRVVNGNFVVSGLQTVADAIGGFFNGLGALLTGRNDAKIQAIEAAAAQISRGNLATTIAGVTYMTIGDTIILPLGGNRVVAAGAGNIVAAGAGNIVAGGAGNIVAGGAGNIVAAGAGNLIANDGSSLTSSNLASLVGSSSANVVNLGAGNLFLKGTNQLIANDGGSLLGSRLAATSGVVAAGGGNIVASGGGNIVAAGAGNIVAAGAGNIVAAGAGNVANPGSSASVVVATPGGNFVGGSAQRLANQVPSGIVAGGAGNIVAGGAGNIVAGGAGN